MRLRAANGAEGLGYTYTVDAGGAAVPQPDRTRSGAAASGQNSGRIEHLWQLMWWHLHFVGRGGLAAFAIAAVDTALWDLRAPRRPAALAPARRPRSEGQGLCWRHRPAVPARAPARADRRQSGSRLSRHQDEGRQAAAWRGSGAGRGDARAAWPRHTADGQRQHALAGRRRSGHRARSPSTTFFGSKSPPSPTT